MSQDYPDGMSRLLPGHTIDLETGFAQPWYNGSSVVIASGATGSYTLSFNDDEHIYYIDEINVSPSAYKEFTVFVKVNGVPYVCGSVMGFFFHKLRVNPSLLFITGDEVEVEILNLDSSQRTFSVKIHGTKVFRPVGYGKAPAAAFTASPEITDIITPVAFTDVSLESPTSWDWDFDDDSVHSTSQNPSHVYSVAGTYQPKLKASNAYGWDTYAEHDMITVQNDIYWPNFIEVDPASYILCGANSCKTVACPGNVDAYFYNDYGNDYFKTFAVEFCCRIESMDLSSAQQVFAVGNDVSSGFHDSGGRIQVLAYRDGDGVYKLGLQYILNDSVIDQSLVNVGSSGYFYCRLSKSYSSSVVTLQLYSDSSFTTLIGIADISNAYYVDKAYRYLYGVSSYHNDWSTVATVWCMSAVFTILS